jgi:uncharacterized RDD family membrane protein YckC
VRENLLLFLFETVVHNTDLQLILELQIKLTRPTMKKYTEKLVMVLTVYLAITTLKHLVWYFEFPDWITEIKIPNIYDIEYLTFAIMRLLVPVLVLLGVIRCFRKKEFRLNKLFVYPIYYIFLNYIIQLFRKLSPLFEYAKFEFNFSFILKTVFMVAVVYYFYGKHEHQPESNILLSKKNRAVNFLIDSFIILICFISFLPNFSGMFDNMQNLSNDLEQLSKYLWILPSFYFIYYCCFEIVFLQTIGKLITGSQVRFKESIFGSIILRTISRFIPLEFISFIILKEGLHDKISKTNVTVADKVQI